MNESIDVYLFVFQKFTKTYTHLVFFAKDLDVLALRSDDVAKESIFDGDFSLFFVRLLPDQRFDLLAHLLHVLTAPLQEDSAVLVALRE